MIPAAEATLPTTKVVAKAASWSFVMAANVAWAAGNGQLAAAGVVVVVVVDVEQQPQQITPK